MRMGRTRGGARPRISPAGRRIRMTASGVAAGLVVAALALVVANVSTIDPSEAGFLWNTPSPQPVVPLTAAFIGDSYSAGVGASAPALRWTTLVAGREGWTELNVAMGGTGYVKTGGIVGCGRPFCPRYLEVVPDVIRAEPDVVIVAGGQNDLRAFPLQSVTIIAAIQQTFAELRAGLPDARIIAVGPSTPGIISEAVIGIDAAVQAAAAAVGAEYISLTEPNVIDPAIISPDRVHVGDAGHSAIADRVTAALNATVTLAGIR